MKTIYNIDYSKIKLNVDLSDFEKNSVIPLILSNSNLLLLLNQRAPIITNFWNRRLKDSEIDNCVELTSDYDDFLIIPNRKYTHSSFLSKIIKNDDGTELYEFFITLLQQQIDDY